MQYNTAESSTSTSIVRSPFEHYEKFSRTQISLRVERLIKIYSGGIRAVNDISFHVAPGEIFALMVPTARARARW